MKPQLSRLVADSVRAMESVLGQEAVFQQVAAAAVHSLQSGGKILTCGNGGSAADAMHLAEELLGRYRRNRRPLPALALNADPTVLTCIGNDFGFEAVFSRQITALAGPNDLLVCFSTSGNSPNVLAALDAARAVGAKTAAFLGGDGGAARNRADWAIVVDSADTARIQEAHTLLLHALLEWVESEIG